MEWQEHAAEMWGAGVAVAGGAWWLYSKKLRPILQQRHARDQLVLNSQRFVGTRLLLKDWLNETGAMRCLWLSAKNNGKEFPPDSPVRVSCIDQAVSHGVRNTWKDWRNWECDPPYRQFLCDLIQHRRNAVILTTDTMEPSVLRTAYEAQGTFASVVFSCMWDTDEKALLYFSLNFGEEPPRAPDLTDKSTEERAVAIAEHAALVTSHQDRAAYYVDKARELYVSGADRLRRFQQAARNVYRGI